MDNLDRTTAQPTPASETGLTGVGNASTDTPIKKRKRRTTKARYLSVLKRQLTLNKNQSRPVAAIKRKIKTLSESMTFGEYYERFKDVETL